jgi:hypothetical protein
MAKWGFGGRWGGGTLWGGTGVVATPFNGYVVWIVNIDWFGAGAVNESDYVRDVDTIRGRQHYVKPAGSGFEQMRPGKSVLTMDNSNGRFDPYNTDSPLYGYLLPGRKIQISVYDVVTKQTHVRFTGHITDIQPSSGINEVTITAEDGIRWLSDAEYSTGVTYSKTVSEAIDLVLSFVNWPYQRNIIYTNEPLQVFEPGEGSAINVIQDLAEANIGVFFVDRFGTACFYPISYDVTTSHAIDQSQILREIRIPRPWETVRNKIRIVANRRGKRPGTAVWTMAGKEHFAAGETKVFGATFKVSDGLTVENIIANTQIDGNGVDVSNYFTIGKSDITATECTLTITNNYSTADWLLSLRLIGNAIVSAPENKTDFDATSIATYGPRSFVLNNPWLQDRNFAGAYVTMVKNHLKDSRKDPIIQIQQRPDIQYPIDLYDKVVLTSTNLGISETFTVGGIEEKWMSDTGQDVITTLYLQTVLYDPTYIEPDPFIPGDLPIIPLPDIPPWIDPYIPPIPPIPPDWTFNCLTESAPNGPFSLTPIPTVLTTTPSVLVSTMNYPCTLRAKTALYKSILTLNIKTYSLINDQWTPYVPNSIISVTAFNKSNVDVISAAVTGGGTAMIARTAMFYPETAIEVAGFRIYLANSAIPGVPSSDITSTSDGAVVDFNFDLDQSGWIPEVAPFSGDPIFPTSPTVEYWGNKRLNLKRPDGYAGGDHIYWKYPVPIICTAPTGSKFEGTVYATGDSPCLWIHYAGSSNQDESDQYASGLMHKTATSSSDNNGFIVDYFKWDNQHTVGGTEEAYLDDVKLTGFVWADATEKKIEIITVTASNVCGTGLV